MRNTKPVNGTSFFSTLRTSIYGEDRPSVSKIAEEARDPFRVLVSTIISSRTKDEVTLQAAERLFAAAATPRDLAELTEQQIAEYIYPAGFYTTKAGNLRKTAEVLLRDFGGKVPPVLEELLKLPGVGRKTANLVLNLGFAIPAICVDTHVHRIVNRTGFVATKQPNETERELMKALPEQYWIEINELLVSFGKKVCMPQSPFCSTCPFSADCPKIGVKKHR